MKGRKSHKIVSDALGMLCNLEHRGAVGADPLAGDGAGILIQIPHAFLKDECKKLGFTLPEPGQYAAGHIFLPQDERLRTHCERVWARCLSEEGLELLGWRSVPVDNSCLSDLVRDTEPVHRQVFVGRGTLKGSEDDFERHLYMVRKVVSNAIQFAYKGRDIGHYTVSLSCRTLVYKGMFLSGQVGAYYKDLDRSAPRLGHGARAPALLDQHVPVVEAGAPLSHGRAQRRDQHAARQRQLDGGAASERVLAAVRATTSPSCGRSPTKASPTPPASTTRSNSSCRAATPSRTPR